MYILVNKNTNKVFQVSGNKPISYSDNLILCEVDFIPLSYDYLVAENIHEETITSSQILEDYDDNGEIVTRTEERSKTYNTCDLVARFREKKTLTEEEIKAQKEKARSEKIVKLIRLKYSVDDELAILRQRDSKPEKYAEYYAYVEDCVASVPKGV